MPSRAAAALRPLVQHSVAALIAAVAKYELGAGRWPALLELTDRCCQSAIASQREVGMFLLSSIARDSNQVLEPYFDHFVQLLVRALQDTDSTATRVYAFQYAPYRPSDRCASQCGGG